MPTSKRKEKSRKESGQDDLNQADGGVALPASKPSEKPVVLSEDAEQTQKREPSSSTRRRRPRKLARRPVETPDSQNLEDAEPETTAPSEDKMESEIHVLKKKVQDLEAQVQKILDKQPAETKSKTSRRRTRNPKDPTKKEVDDIEELERLRGDLAEAKIELAKSTVGNEDDNQKKPKQKRERPQKRAEQQEQPAENAESDVEEIMRDSIPGSEARPSRPSRPKKSMTFSGSYRLPMPAAVSEDDLSAVKQGLRGVQNIAKKVIAESREQPNARGQLQRTKSGNGWSSWLGGYSLSVAKFVNNIEFQSSSENTEPTHSDAQLAITNPEPHRRKPPKLRPKNGPADVGGGGIESDHAAGLLK